MVLHDKWHIDARIARGGVATVYRATHRQGQVAAIKIMHPEYARNEEVRKRFLREGYAANKVGHRGVVRVLDDDVTSDGSAYIVMELLHRGELLEDMRERLGGRLPIAEAVEICHQVLDVLAVAHEKGIIHRDIKPENVFVLDDGTVKVLDFGIAHLKELARQQEATATGMMLGTPEYMSPEQVLGKRGQIDAQTDVYAVGATLFTLLSGEAVHVQDNLNALLVATASRQARSLSSVAFKELPRGLVTVVDKALALEKPRRYASARAMQVALREVVPASAAALARATAMQRAPSTEVYALREDPAQTAQTAQTAQNAPRPPRPSGGPPRVPPASRAPISFVPPSGPTAVIPVRPGGPSSNEAPGTVRDPWTDELSADDLDAPTVATSGSVPGLQAPLPSALVARPSQAPPPPMAPRLPSTPSTPSTPRADDSTRPLAREERVNEPSTTMNLDPLAASGQRASVTPPPSAQPATPRLLPSPYGPPPQPMQSFQSTASMQPSMQQARASMPQPSSEQAAAPAWNGQSYTGPPPPMGRMQPRTNPPPPVPAAGAPPLVVAAIVGAAVVLLALALGVFFYLRAS
jgi:serine/threonine protein kinase